MKKKIWRLLLCVCLVVPLALASCSSGSSVDTNSDVNSTRVPVSISMWVVTDKATTPEEEKAMADAFNEVTKSDYSTRVVFSFFTEEEYEEQLNAKLAKCASNRNGLPKLPTDPSAYTYRDERGITTIRWPDVNEYQADIVLITGEEMYRRYASSGYLTALDDVLNNTYKDTIMKAVNTAMMENAKYNDSWYAIPNNHMVGEYTYMLVNKEMAEKYYFSESDFTSFGTGTAAARLIDDIAKWETDVAPMEAMVNGYPLAKYWNLNGATEESVLATLYPNAQTKHGDITPSAENLFADEKYQSFMSELFYCKENGYFRDGQSDFGVAIVSGDHTVYDEYKDDYYITVLGTPRIEESDVFGSMFAVTKYTANLSRCMEILEDLTADSRSELRNILQYGVEGVHYELDSNGVVSRLERGRNYRMNINYTGNVFLAYPEEGMDPDVWTQAKLQNRDASLSLVYGTAPYLENVNAEAWAAMSEASRSYFERLYACKTQAEFHAFLEAATAEIRSSSYYKALTTQFSEGGGYDRTSLSGALGYWDSITYPDRG